MPSRPLLLGVVVLTLGELTLAHAGHTPQDVKNDADAKAICATVKGFVPGPEATASDEDRKAFADEPFCADYVYQMVGDERDYAKARRCCLAKGDCNRELAMIFANGWGVPRDYDAALHFLCRVDGDTAPAEQWGMLEHVQRMRAGRETRDLEYCEYVTSGRGMTFCEQVASARSARAAEETLAALKTTIPADAHGALAALQKAADALASRDGGVLAEPTRGGTAYPSEGLAGERQQREAFAAMLARFTSTRAEAASAAAAKRADAALNEAYKTAMRAMPRCTLCDAEPDGGREMLRDAQRAWIAYRDAWIAFYRTRWTGAAAPDVLQREIATAVTNARTAFLRTLGAEK